MKTVVCCVLWTTGLALAGFLGFSDVFGSGALAGFAFMIVILLLAVADSEYTTSPGTRGQDKDEVRAIIALFYLFPPLFAVVAWVIQLLW